MRHREDDVIPSDLYVDICPTCGGLFPPSYTQYEARFRARFYSETIAVYDDIFPLYDEIIAPYSDIFPSYDETIALYSETIAL